MNVTAALQAAQRTGANRTDARYLLCHLLGVDRAWLIQHDDADLPPETVTRFAALCQRLAEGEPLAYLTGEREFHGLRLAVAPGVLIPRPDTEVLVDWALDCLRACSTPHARVIDLGTGSGAVALAIAGGFVAASLRGSGLSPSAVDNVFMACCNARQSENNFRCSPAQESPARGAKSDKHENDARALASQCRPRGHGDNG